MNIHKILSMSILDCFHEYFFTDTKKAYHRIVLLNEQV